MSDERLDFYFTQQETIYKHSVYSVNHLEEHRMANSMSGTLSIPTPSWSDESVISSLMNRNPYYMRSG